MKICSTCHKEFQERKDSQIFCSTQCRGLARRKDKKKIVCKHCGKEFSVVSWMNAKFCSVKCSSEHKKNRIQQICLNCKNSFEVLGYQKTIFCSRKCSNEYAIKTEKNKYKEEEKSKVTKICEYCKKEFRVWKYRKNARFCSKPCFSNAGRVNLQCTKCGVYHSEERNTLKDNLNMELFCKKCRNLNNTSAFEIQIKNYLIDIFGSEKIKANQRISYEKGKYIYPDIVVNNKLIIECNGDFFHCNPEFFNSDYYNNKIKKYAWEIWQRDIFKLDIYKKYGYNVMIIWESNWKKKKEEIKELLINEIRKNQINQTCAE